MDVGTPRRCCFGEMQETWRRLGFVFTTAEDLTAFGILHTDLIHMDNTVQMHKTVAPPRIWKTVIFRYTFGSAVMLLGRPGFPCSAGMGCLLDGKIGVLY